MISPFIKTSVFFILLFSVSILILPQPLNAQNLNLSSSDLSKVKIDDISDEQIQEALKKASAAGYSQSQVEAAALAKGLPQSELNKLQIRMNTIKTTGTKNQLRSDSERVREEQPVSEREDFPKEDLFDSFFTDPTDTAKVKEDPRLKIFGFSLFNSKNLTFEPQVNVPTPVDYQLGPGDELVIDIWGASQQNYQLTVSPDGFIVIDNIGPVSVNGLTIEKASIKLIGRLSAIYSGLKGPKPNTFAQVSLGNLKSIKVILLGEVNLPGSYTLSSLSTAFNALYLSGGPNITGSLRNIDIIRGNKVISSLDVYDFLLKADKSIDIRLNDQDIVKVNPYNTRVNLSGEVKRPAIYEMKDSEKLEDLISFAGGFSDKAYTHRLKIYRNTTREKQLLDVPFSDLPIFSLHNGDSIVIEPILDRFENRVEIKGALYRPGMYSLDDQLSLINLIEKAEGVRGDAFLSHGIIYRTRPDFSIEAISVDISAIISGKADDILLKREDIVNIPSIFDLQEEFFVEIDGEVKNPGKYPFRYNSSLQDIIIMSGGLLESASLAHIEIARRVKDTNTMVPTLKVADLKTFSIEKELSLSDSASFYKLEPFDRISIRKSPGYKIQETVKIEGEVIFPGEYSISSKAEKISDIIKRSGGLTNEAFPQGASLIRIIRTDEKERIKLLENIRVLSSDSLVVSPILLDKEQPIGINLVKILEEPGSKYDLLVHEGDILKIPKQLQTVRLSGSLLRPSTVRFDEKFGFKEYINRAGGFADEAKKSKAYVLYANGSIDRTKSFLFIKNYPLIEPGAEIVVPMKAEKQRMSAGEAMSLGSVAASLALILVTVINSVSP